MIFELTKYTIILKLRITNLLVQTTTSVIPTALTCKLATALVLPRGLDRAWWPLTDSPLEDL